MDTRDFVKLLSKAWPAIQNEMGKDWEDFASAYKKALGHLPESARRCEGEEAAASAALEVERTREDIQDFLKGDPYCRGLLNGYAMALQGEGADRAVFNEPQGQVWIEDVCNEFWQILAAIENAGGRPEPTRESQETTGGEETCASHP